MSVLFDELLISGKKTLGTSPEEAHEAMRLLLGLTPEGTFDEPRTSPQFTGLTNTIALFLEGPVSEALSFHAGWARLDSFSAGTAQIRLGGGCEGCPSSKITLFQGVKTQLQSRFGEDVVLDVFAT
ncbi:MAG: NifU family protein [Proteobacteria bacterium]|nr:NifU family protein [Pseudomonadota bacterium]